MRTQQERRRCSAAQGCYLDDGHDSRCMFRCAASDCPGYAWPASVLPHPHPCSVPIVEPRLTLTGVVAVLDEASSTSPIAAESLERWLDHEGVERVVEVEVHAVPDDVSGFLEADRWRWWRWWRWAVLALGVANVVALVLLAWEVLR